MLVQRSAHVAPCPAAASSTVAALPAVSRTTLSTQRTAAQLGYDGYGNKATLGAFLFTWYARTATRAQGAAHVHAWRACLLSPLAAALRCHKPCPRAHASCAHCCRCCAALRLLRGASALHWPASACAGRTET